MGVPRSFDKHSKKDTLLFGPPLIKFSAFYKKSARICIMIFGSMPLYLTEHSFLYIRICLQETREGSITESFLLCL